MWHTVEQVGALSRGVKCHGMLIPSTCHANHDVLSNNGAQVGVLSLGAKYHGVWQDPETLHITIADTRGISLTPTIGKLRVRMKPVPF